MVEDATIAIEEESWLSFREQDPQVYTLMTTGTGPPYSMDSASASSPLTSHRLQSPGHPPQKPAVPGCSLPCVGKTHGQTI